MAQSKKEDRGEIIMTKIAFFNNKGGVGKSTSVINVAHAMSKRGKRVVVLDCDLQQNTFKFFSDVPEMEFTDDERPTRYENIDIAFLYSGEENYAPDGYDYVICDLPPSLDERTTRIMSSCDYVFVPLKLGKFAVQGLPKVTEAIAPTNAKIGGIFVCMYDKKNTSDIEFDKAVRDIIGGNLTMKSRIPYYRRGKNSDSRYAADNIRQRERSEH
jgi:chromosome partitioning protein